MQKPELSKTGPAGRSSGIDLIKGICMILVVISHTVTFDALPGPVGMVMRGFFLSFFMASGWLAFHRTVRDGKELRSVIAAKLRKLAVPYITFSILTVLWHIVICVIFHNTAVSDVYSGWTVILRDVFCMVSGLGIGTLWFLPVLFLSYTVLMSVLFCSREKRRNESLFLGTVILAFLVLTYLFGRIRLAPVSLAEKIAAEYTEFFYRIAYGCAYSFLGYLVRSRWEIIVKERKIRLPASFFAAAALLVSRGNAVIFDLALCVFLFVSIMCFSGPAAGSRRFFGPVLYAGMNSLAIMIIHYNFLYPVERPFFSGWLLFAVNLSTTLLAVRLLQNSRSFRRATGA